MSSAGQHSPQQVRIAFVVTLLGGLLFTLDLPLLKLSGADQWTMVFTRGCFLFIAISLGWLFNRLVLDEKTPFVAGRAGILVAITSTIGNIAYIGAVVNTTAANVVFLIALTPVMAAALARVVLGERVHPFTWCATFVAFAGVGIIARDGIGLGHTEGNLLALLSAFCSACAFTVIRATGKKVATSLAIGSLSSALIALFFFPLSLASLGATAAIGMPAWMWLAFNGLMAVPLATVLLASGSRFLPSAEVSMFFLLETVLTPVWAWLLFAEAPRPAAISGGAIIVATLAAHSWWKLAATQKLANA
jgi:drug/metabolite transporter (DMT)-like permease